MTPVTEEGLRLLIRRTTTKTKDPNHPICVAARQQLSRMQTRGYKQDDDADVEFRNLMETEDEQRINERIAELAEFWERRTGYSVQDYKTKRYKGEPRSLTSHRRDLIATLCDEGIPVNMIARFFNRTIEYVAQVDKRVDRNTMSMKTKSIEERIAELAKR